jgi:acyl dehydratase
MSIDYQKLKDWALPEIEHVYRATDTMLYALGVAVGSDPLDERQLRFVYEKDLAALPSMAVVLAHPGFWLRDSATGVDWVKVVHGEQRLRLHQLVAPAGSVRARTRVTHILDKGRGKGAILVSERQVVDSASGALIATIEQTTFCRGDGGYSESGQPSDAAPEPLPSSPDRAPDTSCEFPTRPETALIYRLSGDFNPLHAEPAIAHAAGYPKPILHGLATYGVVGHAILKRCCNYEPHRLKALHARFSAPAFPGDTIRTEIWGQSGTVQFRARAVERDVVVLTHGVAEIV